MASLRNAIMTKDRGRLRLLGTIENPVAIRALLDHLAASAEGVDRAPLPITLEPATLAAQV